MTQLNTGTGKFQGRSEDVTVWLLPGDTSSEREPPMFWCPTCRGPIAQYLNGKIQSIVPGRAPKMLTPMIRIMCRNTKCRKTYNFAGIVGE